MTKVDPTFRKGLAFALGAAGFGGMTQLAAGTPYVPYLWALCWICIVIAPAIWWWEHRWTVAAKISGFFGTALAQPNAVAQATADDPSIVFDCDLSMEPPELSSQPLAIVALMAREQNGVARMSGTRGSKYLVGDGNRRFGLYRCTVTNHGQKPVFNVHLELGLLFTENVRINENTIQSGQTALQTSCSIEILKLDANGSAPFEFYMHNSSDKWVQIFLPEMVSLSVGGDPTQRNVRLIKSKHLRLSLAPAE